LNFSQGDLVLKVMAEDGDKGSPREIRYGLLTQNNPFTPFFEMNESTGERNAKRTQCTRTFYILWYDFLRVAVRVCCMLILTSHAIENISHEDETAFSMFQTWF
jgi:hypothetical protein